MSWEILGGDCIDTMRGMAENSIDSIVTDPPYGLGFMGKQWDELPPGEDFAREALRVAKPGAHIVAFGGSRTVHRLACALEDAGWEIRDSLLWLYWSGFPKSLDVSKAVDGHHGRAADREVLRSYPGAVQSAQSVGGGFSGSAADERGRTWATVTAPAPATDDAKQWAGWGTALKPAHEPAILARKPLEGTVAANVLQWGTGGINIDGCRFEPGDHAWPGPQGDDEEQRMGRWPANLYACPKPSRTEREAGCRHLPGKSGAEAVGRKEGSAGISNPRAGAGAKLANVKNHHPTVKPIALMSWLCRLVTPPDGVVLDPFCGSGTTGIAALREGFSFVGIEREAEYQQIAKARIVGDAPLLRWAGR